MPLMPCSRLMGGSSIGDSYQIKVGKFHQEGKITALVSTPIAWGNKFMVHVCNDVANIKVLNLKLR